MCVRGEEEEEPLAPHPTRSRHVAWPLVTPLVSTPDENVLRYEVRPLGGSDVLASYERAAAVFVPSVIALSSTSEVIVIPGSARHAFECRPHSLSYRALR